MTMKFTFRVVAAVRRKLAPDSLFWQNAGAESSCLPIWVKIEKKLKNNYGVKIQI